MNRNRCITVKSVTYAQKAKRLLAAKGINSYLSRRNSCHWCVKVSEAESARAYEILRQSGVPMTGEITDDLS